MHLPNRMPAKNEKEEKAAPPVSEAHVEVTDELDAELEALLQTNPSEGLTDEDAKARLEKFGLNGELNR